MSKQLSMRRKHQPLSDLIHMPMPREKLFIFQDSWVWIRKPVFWQKE